MKDKKPVIYRKRMYNFRLFFGDMFYMVANGFSVIGTLVSGRIPRATAEKIMLATTAVNDCVHCARLHSTLALIHGVDQSEIDEILQHDVMTSVEKDERVALAFAQHYAEHDRKPDPKAMQALVDEYGPRKSRDIIHFIRIIYIGNLIGNTVDGFRGRFLGVKPQNGNLLFELFLLFVFVPLMLPFVLPAALCVQFRKRRSQRGSTQWNA